MRLKSRGLGRKELVMDFREYTVTREGNEIVINGTIREPVHWDFSIRMCEDDLPGLVKVAASRKTLGFLLRAAFKRNKEAHWSLDRKEHLEAVKAAIAAREESKSAEEEKAEKKGARLARSGAAAKPAEAAKAEKAETEKAGAEEAPGSAETDEEQSAEPASTSSGKKMVSFARPRTGPEGTRSGKEPEGAGAGGNGSSDEPEATVATGAAEGDAP